MAYQYDERDMVHGAPPPPPHGAPPPPPHGAPPPPPHGAPPPPPHGAPPEIRWLFNDEGLRDTKKFAEMIKLIAEKILERGKVTISGVTINLPEKCWTVIRYEQMPGGEYSLKLELIWQPQAGELKIE